MQYASALALASLSGKAPSIASFIQPRTLSPPSSRPPVKNVTPLKSMQFSRQSTTERLTKYHPIYLGHQQRSQQSSLIRCPCPRRQEGGKEEGRAQEGCQEARTRARGRRRFRNGPLRMIHLNPYWKHTLVYLDDNTPFISSFGTKFPAKDVQFRTYQDSPSRKGSEMLLDCLKEGK